VQYNLSSACWQKEAPNSRPEVDRNVRDDDLSSNCSLEKPPNKPMKLTGLRPAAYRPGVGPPDTYKLAGRTRHLPWGRSERATMTRLTQ
jgi:hypothetical protein